MRAILLLLTTVFVLSSPVLAERRVALVVGNGAYQHATRLGNPINDGQDISAALRRLGFDVISVADATSEQFDKAVDAFGKKANGADVALFYYSGHGLQHEGVNYLLPVDAQIDSAFALRRKAVVAQDVLREMEGRAKASLVFLDACRTNTVVRELQASLPEQYRQSAGLRGLARMEGRGNSLVAYSAAPNEVAADGTGQRNSPFTSAVLRHISKPGVAVLEVLTDVISDVELATRRAQRPEFISKLTTQIRLNPIDQKIVARQENERAAASTWDLIKDSCDRTTLEGFRNRYSGTSLVERVRDRLAGMDAGKFCAAPPPPPAVVAVVPPVAPEVPRTITAPAPPSAPSVSGSIALDMQREMKRLGCYTGTLDGDWGTTSRVAFRQYLRLARLDNAEEPTVLHLDQARMRRVRLCPLVCSTEERIVRGRCVPKAEGPKKKPDTSAGSGSTAARVVRGGSKPNASAYSYTIWPAGAVPTGMGVTRMTPYGRLTCSGSTMGGPSRPCHWN